MPVPNGYTQPWIDPNTGATYLTSFVRISDVQPDPQSQRIAVAWNRWADLSTYSLGLQPVQAQATIVTGSAYLNDFAPPLRTAQTQFRALMIGATGSFIVGAAEFSGAVVVP